MSETPEDPSGSAAIKNLFTLSLEMLAVAADGYLVEVNPAWTNIVGWTSQELTGRRFLDFVHPDDLAATRAQMRELTDGEPATDFSNRFRHRDGSYRVIRWSLHPKDDVIYVGASDVSHYVQMRERAERGEAVATGVLRTAVDPIIVIDTAGTIMDANDATSKLFGYAFHDLVGQNINILMPEPYRSEHTGYIERYLRDGDPRVIGIGREVEAQRADGTIFPIALAVSEVRNATDHLFTGIIHDLTERNHQRDQLKAANTELEQRVVERTSQLQELLEELRRSNHDLEQFAYVASHDLQAPLRNVRQGLELLDEHLAETAGTGFDDEAHELRDLVVAAVLRMEELIRGLLSYSRVQKSSHDERTALELDDVVGDVMTMLLPEIEAVSGTIGASDLPRVVGNPLQLRQLFQNLIENAIRYRSSDRNLEVTIGVHEQSAATSTIEVRDNGSGIEVTHHERIFELFRRGHSGYDGVGLGLAICKRIVEGHGGRIWVESAPGEGAAFRFRLPTV